jgi:hypothetical protein
MNCRKKESLEASHLGNSSFIARLVPKLKHDKLDEKAVNRRLRIGEK